MKFENIQIQSVDGNGIIKISIKHKILAKKIRIRVDKMGTILDYSKRSNRGKDRYEAVMEYYIYEEEFKNCDMENIKDNIRAVADEIVEARDISVKQNSYIFETAMTIEELSNKGSIKKMLNDMISKKILKDTNKLEFLTKKIVSGYYY